MTTSKIIEAIDAEISRLEQVKALLNGNGGAPAKRGASAAPAVTGSAAAKKRRPLSPEARARIVAAQKKRWAKVKAAKKK
jgi:hypothetical protein